MERNDGKDNEPGGGTSSTKEVSDLEFRCQIFREYSECADYVARLSKRLSEELPFSGAESQRESLLIFDGVMTRFNGLSRAVALLTGDL